MRLSRNRTVTIWGYPHYSLIRIRPFIPRKPFVAHAFSLVMLWLELRLIETIKKTKFNIIYKAHPDFTKELKEIIEEQNIIFFEKPFERAKKEILKRTDIFLVPHITTTTFSSMLLSNKGIVVLDLSFKHNPFKEPMELLKKRVTIVRTWINERNLPEYSEKELYLQ